MKSDRLSLKQIYEYENMSPIPDSMIKCIKHVDRAKPQDCVDFITDAV